MRKEKPKLRIMPGDPRYDDKLVSRFVNNLMMQGKKATAFKIFYDAMDILDEKKGEEDKSGYELWKEALNNVMPQVEVRSRRIGGATFQIPTEIPANRKISIGMKWMIKFARQRNGRSMADKLAAEIKAAANNEGVAVKRKEDTHKMAESNRAFAHFRV